ncbi:tail fiber protein [Bradyrhizobium sp. B117]|uniref:tail fiber protein n=1 Tax=Bradyrhizobium sp. B117 TaxID=3140246 RepID=UPI003183EFD0
MSSTPYDRQTSFALQSAENPKDQIPGNLFDAEFNAIKLSMDDTQQNLAKIQDDDGVLKRGSVGQAQFDSSVSLGFAAPTQWASGVLYTANVNTVFYNSIFYIANTTHTSGPSFEPAKWDEIADFTAAAAIPDGSITSAKLAPGAVGSDKLGDGVVSNSKLATGAVTTNKLADANVTPIKLSSDVGAALVNSIFPPGLVLPYAGSAAPTGWLLCQGQSLLRADYPGLFAALGTIFGSTDGTHFNVPDLRGRVPIGVDGGANRVTTAGGGIDGATLGASGGQQNHTLLTANLPPYTPAGTITNGAISISSNAITGSTTTGGGGFPAGSNTSATITASQGASTFTGAAQGGSSTPVQTLPPGIVLNYLIKAH